MSAWLRCSPDHHGVAFLNESKHGYETRDNEIRLSLLKSATSPDPVADQGDLGRLQAIAIMSNCDASALPCYCSRQPDNQIGHKQR